MILKNYSDNTVVWGGQWMDATSQYTIQEPDRKTSIKPRMAIYIANR